MSEIFLRDLIGVKFKTHGRSIEEGYDCYGLAIEVERRAGKALADVWYEGTSDKENIKTAELVRKGISLEKIDCKEPYCLVDIAIDGGKTSHVGVYLGNGEMIHSTRECGVCIQNIQRYKSLIKGYYKVV